MPECRIEIKLFLSLSRIKINANFLGCQTSLCRSSYSHFVFAKHISAGKHSGAFCFEGFLPPKKGRNKRMTGLADERRTMIFYESPFRLVKTLTELAIYLGPDRSASVSRELSKMFEENIRGTLSFLAEYYTNKPPKGEIVIVVAGKKD